MTRAKADDEWSRRQELLLKTYEIEREDSHNSVVAQAAMLAAIAGFLVVGFNFLDTACGPRDTCDKFRILQVLAVPFVPLAIGAFMAQNYANVLSRDHYLRAIELEIAEGTKTPTGQVRVPFWQYISTLNWGAWGGLRNLPHSIVNFLLIVVLMLLVAVLGVRAIQLVGGKWALATVVATAIYSVLLVCILAIATVSAGETRWRYLQQKAQSRLENDMRMRAYSDAPVREYTDLYCSRQPQRAASDTSSQQVTTDQQKSAAGVGLSFLTSVKLRFNIRSPR